MTTTSLPPIRTSERDGARVLHLDGVVSVIAADALYAVARESACGAGPLVVDCSRTEHLDCAALQILVALSRHLARDGRTLAFEGVQPALAGYIALAGLEEALFGAAAPAAGIGSR